MAEIFLKRTLSGFEAADDAAKEAMRKWAPGTQVKANCRVPRALRSLRRYWALVGMVQENTDMFPSRDALHAFLKIRAGHCTPIVIKASGEIVLVPNSIDFDTLGEDEFMDVWRRVCDVVVSEILPGITQADLELEVQRLIGLAR